MSEADSDRMRADLTLVEERLSERTRQRDDIQLRLIKSNERLDAASQQLAESLLQNKETANTLFASNALLESKDLELAERTASLAVAALELSNRTNQLHETNKYLTKKTAELEEVNLALKEIIQQREDFVAALTHDLKNPLIGSTRILELLSQGRIPNEEHAKLFPQLVESNKGMLNMIWNMLDTYRYDCGQLKPNNQTIDIVELLQQCLKEFSYSIEAKNIDLVLHFQKKWTL